MAARRRLLVCPSAENEPTSVNRSGGEAACCCLKSAKKDGFPTARRWHFWGSVYGTRVPFAKSGLAFNFAGEQFWGRAARAPRSRKRFEALVIWGGVFLGGLSTSSVADQLVEMVKLTVILAWVSTASLPSRRGLKCHCLTASWAAEARMCGPLTTRRF